MGLTLTTVSNGTAITASAIRGYVTTVEKYLNEEIAAADLKTSAAWVTATQVFRPEFMGSPYPHTELVTGETHYRYTNADPARRAIHHDVINADQFVAVPGLQVTYQVPETLTGSAPAFIATILTSFYTYEYGGAGSRTEGARCADFRLAVNGTTVASTERRLYTASRCTSDFEEAGAFLARKQHSMLYFQIAAAGVHHAGVYVKVYTRTASGSTDDWRHIFVAARSIVVDWYHR